MRIVQRVFLYLISLAILVAGIGIAAYPFSPRIAELAHHIADRQMMCLLIGCIAVALGIFTLLPFDLFGRRRRSMSFAGATGTVSIAIDPVEASLRKTIAKLPMVKRAAVTVTPKDNDRKVAIAATVSLKKPAETSTRETAERLREFIDSVARQIVGVDEVTSVDVRIEDVIIDASQTAESLNSIFLNAEKSVTAMPRVVTPPTEMMPPTAAPIDRGHEALDAARAQHEEIVQARADAGAGRAEARSPDLLTYEEAETMDRDRPEEHEGPDQEEHHDAAPLSTSFDAIAEDTPSPGEAPHETTSRGKDIDPGEDEGKA